MESKKKQEINALRIRGKGEGGRGYEAGEGKGREGKERKERGGQLVGKGE